MKKFLYVGLCGLMAFLCAAVKPVQAQNTVKKVAILEVVDKENKVPYSIKSMLRGALSEAITKTPGYNGFDRVDISSIMDEQNFQRTGLVNDNEIRELGKMTGAAYILLPEAVYVDKAHFYITVKLLNVETAQLEKSQTSMSGSTPEEVDETCKKLAADLFGLTAANTKDLGDGFHVEDGVLYDAYGNVVSKREVFDAFGNYMKGNGKIYDYNGDKFGQQQLRTYWGGSYRLYQKYLKMYKNGAIMGITGACLSMAGTIFMILGDRFRRYVYYEEDDMLVSFEGPLFIPGCVILPIGGVVTIAGGAMAGVASKNLKKLYKSHATQGYQPTASLTFGGQYYGTGFALRF